jgi:hypothetical protein
MPDFSTLDSKDFLFIIGSPRSGTTMLQIVLGSHPQVATTVELTLFNRYLGPWLKTWDEEVANLRDKQWQQGLPFLFKEEEFMAHARHLLEEAYGRVLATKPGATHLLDKHPAYGRQVGAIKRLLPRARFIHVLRDGRDAASSMVAAREKMGFGAATLPAAAAAWKSYTGAAREAAKFGPDYLEVRYEDLLARGVGAYTEVLEFCGLPIDSTWLAETIGANSFDNMRDRQAAADSRVKLHPGHYRRGTAGGWQAEYSAAERFEFDRIAGDLLCELGYAQPGWWANSASARVLAPLRHGLRLRLRALSSAAHHLKTAFIGNGKLAGE